MKRLFAAALFGLALLSPSQSNLEQRQLTMIVSCVNSKSKDLGISLPQPRSGEVRFRYHMGKYAFAYPDGTMASIGRDDELRLVFYGDNDQKVAIYDVFVATTGQNTKIEIGRPATFQKVNGGWKSGDNPGGVATDLYLRDLLRTLSKDDAITFPLNSRHDSDAHATCSVLQN
jgi:hypothetical protein